MKILFMSALLLCVMTAGCTVDNTDTQASDNVVSQATGQNASEPAPAAADPAIETTPNEPAPPIATDGRDQLDISGAILLGPHAGVPIKSAPITRNMYSARIDGGLVYTSTDPLRWPVPGSPVGGVDARSYIFWVEGSQVYGGQFDWQRPGQTAKTLENVNNGYLGRRPSRGQPVWFALVRIDGRERTNIAISQNPW